MFGVSFAVAWLGRNVAPCGKRKEKREGKRREGEEKEVDQLARVKYQRKKGKDRKC